jgi:hypothetical protein
MRSRRGPQRTWVRRLAGSEVGRMRGIFRSRRASLGGEQGGDHPATPVEHPLRRRPTGRQQGPRPLAMRRTRTRPGQERPARCATPAEESVRHSHGEVARLPFRGDKRASPLAHGSLSPRTSTRCAGPACSDDCSARRRGRLRGIDPRTRPSSASSVSRASAGCLLPGECGSGLGRSSSGGSPRGGVLVLVVAAQPEDLLPLLVAADRCAVQEAVVAHRRL